MRPPVVSVITVLYNNLEGAKLTFESVRKQTFSDLEWIVVDGNSTDGTAEFLYSIEEYISTLIIEPDKGIYDAMNKGIENSGGDYILFLNGGDGFACDSSLANIMNYIDSLNPTPKLVFCDTIFAFSDGTEEVRPAYSEDYIWHSLPGKHQSTLYDAALHKACKHNLDYKVSSDYFTTASMLRREPLAVCVNIPLSKMEFGGESFSNHMRMAQIREAWVVQRDIVGVNLMARLLSMLTRVAGFAVLSLAEKDGGALGKKVRSQLRTLRRLSRRDTSSSKT